MMNGSNLGAHAFSKLNRVFIKIKFILKIMLESYHPKIIDKEAFIKYYSNNKLRRFINDMEKLCETYSHQFHLE